MSESDHAACPSCKQKNNFDAEKAFRRLSTKYQQLADILHSYMSQAPMERMARASNALQMVNILDRIVGGTPTDEGEFPDCCLIGHGGQQGTTSWFCTGILVHPRIVLTAGHCNRPPAPAISRVALRANNQNQLDDAEILSVRRAVVNPLYISTGTFHDMTVVILRNPSRIPPVAIATAAELAAARETTLVGFGNSDVNSTRGFGIKRKVTVPILTPSQDDEATLGFESDVEFVAGGEGFDSCNGDSGGPAYVEVGGTRKLAGLTSRATLNVEHPCGDGGIYTRVAVNLDFIRQTASAAGVTDF